MVFHEQDLSSLFLTEGFFCVCVCVMQQARATLPYLSHFLLAWVTGDLLTFAACPVTIINRKLHFKLQHTQS